MVGRGGDRLDALTTRVEAHEARHHVIELSGAIAAIRFEIAPRGHMRAGPGARTWRADLARYIGTRARASEVLDGKRPRTVAKIGKLHEGLGLRAEVLIRGPDAA